MASYKVSVYTSFSKAKLLWLNLEKNADCYGFQNFFWLQKWFQTVGLKQNIKPRLVFVSDSNQPVMFLPLGLKKYGLYTKLIFLGGEISDYCAPILSHSHSINQKVFTSNIWPEIKRRLLNYDVIHFTKLPTTINHQTNPLVFRSVKHYCNSYYVHLRGNWPNFYFKHTNSKTRYTDRKKIKKLKSLGQLQFITPTTKSEATSVIKTILINKKSHFKNLTNSNIFNQPHLHFLLQIFSISSQHKLIHVSALKLDKKIIAAHFGMIYNNRFYWLITTYNRHWKQYSPGRILLLNLFKWCFKRKINIFDFTIGDEGYKKHWCDKKMLLYSYLEAQTFKGRIYQKITKFHQFIKLLNGTILKYV